MKFDDAEAKSRLRCSREIRWALSRETLVLTEPDDPYPNHFYEALRAPRTTAP